MSRLKTERRTYRYDYVSKHWSQGSPVPSSGVIGSCLNYVETGDPNPGWRENIRAGRSATSSLVGVRSRFKQQRLFYEQIGIGAWKGYSQLTSGRMPLTQTPFGDDVLGGSPTLSEAQQEAAKGLHDSIRKARTQFSAPSFLAEIGEFVKLFTRPVESIFGATVNLAREVKEYRRYYLNVQGGWVGSPTEFYHKLSSAYLAYQWAIKPAASDLAGFAASVDELTNRLGSGNSVPVSGKGKAEALLSEATYAYSGNSPYTLYRAFKKRTAEVKYHGRYIPAPQTAGLSSLGFDLPGVAAGVLEVIPWSWLWDYFVNVSDVLQANLQVNARLAWLERGTKQVVTCWSPGAYARVPAPDNASWYANAYGGKYEASKTGVTRSAAEIPKVDFQFSVPSLWQGLNLATLATQLSAGGSLTTGPWAQHGA